MSKTVVIAIDGPAASGKGVIAQAVARHYRFAHLDTGLLYRAVGWLVLDAPEFSETAAAAAARRLRREGLEGIPRGESVLRQENVGAVASRVAAMGAVREELRELQREFAARPPGDAAGAVLEGRDIGTVVCPEAEVKLYVEASLEARARRRFLEMGSAAESEIRASLEARDRRDRERSIAPLRRADTALLLDTSELSIQESISQAIAICATQLSKCR